MSCCRFNFWCTLQQFIYLFISLSTPGGGGGGGGGWGCGGSLSAFMFYGQVREVGNLHLNQVEAIESCHKMANLDTRQRDVG